jgi:hypothetical protein
MLGCGWEPLAGCTPLSHQSIIIANHLPSRSLPDHYNQLSLGPPSLPSLLTSKCRGAGRHQ